MRKIVGGFFLIICGCKHKSAEQQFIDFINNPKNKITQQISVGEVTTTVKWIPPGYRELMEKQRPVGQEQNNDNDFYYFDIKFDNLKGDKPTKEKVLYLDFDMNKDFSLVNEGDSLMPAICQKIENGMAGSYEYMLAFEKKGNVEKDNDFNLVYKDQLFGIGTMAFVYKAKDIGKIPKLKSEPTK